MTTTTPPPPSDPSSHALRYPDLAALVEQLPWFEHDPSGRITLRDDAAIGPIIDFHSHVGPLGRTRRFDYEREGPPARTIFPPTGVPVDLGVHSVVNLMREDNARMTAGWLGAVVSPPFGPQTTWTLPNLHAEMAAFGVERSVILAMELPGNPHISDAYLAAAHRHDDLVPFVCVNPRNRRWEQRMDEYLERSARGLKVHPYTMLLASDHPRIMAVLRRWSRTGLPVLFHTACTGLEPPVLRRLADMGSYEAPLAAFPDTPFVLGHAGLVLVDQAIDYAWRYDNVWLEIDGQPPEHLTRVFDQVRPDRVLFGTDWPEQPLVLSLAKVLLATEGLPDVRRRVLHDNAHRLLARTEAAAAGA